MKKLSCGIVGLPNVGKSTLFNALTRAMNAESSNYPFCTIDPNIGICEIHDPRVDLLAELFESDRIVYAPLQFLDIAGLVKGASEGAGLGNKFLSHIHEVDAIVHVVRCFEDPDVIHVSGKVDPLEDVQTVEMELILSDLERVDNWIGRLAKREKSDRSVQPKMAFLKAVRDHLSEEKLLTSLHLGEELRSYYREFPLLTIKPIIYLANLDEASLLSGTNDYAELLRGYAKSKNATFLTVSARIEEELAQLPKEEQKAFLKDFNLEESALQALAKCCFSQLGLITFLTAGKMEARAWTIRAGMTAVEAAAEIHTDISKGFIRAEVIPFAEMKRLKSRSKAKDEGVLRAEGRDYIVQDGDVVLFLHAS